MEQSQNIENYYELLDLSPGASLQELEEAYRKACWVYSDQNPNIAEFFSIDEAREVRSCVHEAYKAILALQKPIEAAPSITNKNFQDKLPPQFYYNHIPSHATQENFEEELDALSKEIDPSLERELLKHAFYDGLILKKLRLKQKISLGYISQKTNIGVHHLSAIESNNFTSLPAAVFVKSYIKQYAEVLGLDPRPVSDSYIRLYNEFKQAR